MIRVKHPMILQQCNFIVTCTALKTTHRMCEVSVHNSIIEHVHMHVAVKGHVLCMHKLYYHP